VQRRACDIRRNYGLAGSRPCPGETPAEVVINATVLMPCGSARLTKGAWTTPRGPVPAPARHVVSRRATRRSPGPVHDHCAPRRAPARSGQTPLLGHDPAQLTRHPDRVGTAASRARASHAQPRAPARHGHRRPVHVHDQARAPGHLSDPVRDRRAHKTYEAIAPTYEMTRIERVG
jgi:hypothetical protein